MAELQGTLPAFDEKAAYVDTRGDVKETTPDLGKSSYDDEDANEKPLYVNGEPVISSGRDVSSYLVDLRDDGDPPFTFRSVVLGTVIGGLGAALYQVGLYSTRRSRCRPSEHSLACRSISSSLSRHGSRQCFYSSSFTRLGFSGKPLCQSVIW